MKKKPVKCFLQCAMCSVQRVFEICMRARPTHSSGGALEEKLELPSSPGHNTFLEQPNPEFSLHTGNAKSLRSRESVISLPAGENACGLEMPIFRELCKNVMSHKF